MKKIEGFESLKEATRFDERRLKEDEVEVPSERLVSLFQFLQKAVASFFCSLLGALDPS